MAAWDEQWIATGLEWRWVLSERVIESLKSSGHALEGVSAPSRCVSKVAEMCLTSKCP